MWNDFFRRPVLLNIQKAAFLYVGPSWKKCLSCFCWAFLSHVGNMLSFKEVYRSLISLHIWILSLIHSNFGYETGLKARRQGDRFFFFNFLSILLLLPNSYFFFWLFLTPFWNGGYLFFVFAFFFFFLVLRSAR